MYYLMERIIPRYQTLMKLFSYMDQYNKGSKIRNSEISNVDLFKSTVTFYLCSLIDADGIITQEEVDFINEFCGFSWDIDCAKQGIEMLNIPEFINRVPYDFRYLVEEDNDIPSEDGTTWSGRYIELLEWLGKSIIICDNDISDIEIQTHSDFILLLKDYAKDNLVTFKNETNIASEAYEHTSEPVAHETPQSENSVQTENCIEELYTLVGLNSVKSEVSSLVNLIKVRKIREERGITQPPLSLHLVFSGNPGTGKTTVARILAHVYRELGVLSKGHLVEVDRSGLVAGYVGQTAIKTQEVIDQAKGGILFIDEAYTLVKDGQDYGQEAIDTLLKAMEDNRNDFIVIVAGYSEPMETFLDSNPGLRSRFNKFIKFEDYTPEELFLIFETLCTQNKFTFDSDVKEYLQGYFVKIYEDRNQTFANGRTVRNIFEQVMTNQANRVANMIDEIDDSELMSLKIEDFE